MVEAKHTASIISLKRKSNDDFTIQELHTQKLGALRILPYLAL